MRSKVQVTPADNLPINEDLLHTNQCKKEREIWKEPIQLHIMLSSQF